MTRRKLGTGLYPADTAPTKPEKPNRADRPAIRVEPGMRFGEPHIGGVTVDALASMVWAGESVDKVAEDYERTPAEVLLACWFKARHGTRAWRKRWAAWLDEMEMWRGNYDKVPDPPNRDKS
jgi:uncharacterized protein (DUF433 family)